LINQWWLFGLAITELIIVLVLIIIVSLLIEALFLKLALSIVKNAKNTEFGSVFVTALIMALIGWIPCIGCILSWVIINSRHKTGFGMAIVVWILAGLIALVVTVLIVIFIVGLFGIAIVIPFL
jgi:hypothetical protein